MSRDESRLGKLRVCATSVAGGLLCQSTAGWRGSIRVRYGKCRGMREVRFWKWCDWLRQRPASLGKTTAEPCATGSNSFPVAVQANRAKKGRGSQRRDPRYGLAQSNRPGRRDESRRGTLRACATTVAGGLLFQSTAGWRGSMRVRCGKCRGMREVRFWKWCDWLRQRPASLGKTTAEPCATGSNSFPVAVQANRAKKGRGSQRRDPRYGLAQSNRPGRRDESRRGTLRACATNGNVRGSDYLGEGPWALACEYKLCQTDR